MDKFLPQTDFVGQHVVFFEKIDSTNTYLKKYSKENKLPNGFVVASQFQMNGRGQHKNEWLSSKNKNVLASIYLVQKNRRDQSQMDIGFLVALAVFETIENYLPKKNIYIKWPNDIIVNDKKIAGILIENVLSGSTIYSICGIGINVNEDCFDQLNTVATSLLLQNKKRLSPIKVLEKICEKIEYYYLQLHQPKGAKLLHQKYVKHLYKKGSQIQMTKNKEKVLIIGVDNLGRLIIDRNKKIEKIVYKQGELKWN